MKIALLFFSGTNNTRYITTLIKNRLEILNHEVNVFNIFDKNIKLDKYEMIGIGYPVHAFNAPKYFEKRIRQLKIKNKKYFIYKTSGEPYKYNNASSYKLTKILKNNDFFGEYHFVMPYNILFRTKEEFIRYEMDYNMKYIKYLCDNIQTKKEYKPTLFERFTTFVFKIQRLGCRINSWFYKVDKTKCIRCRKCQVECPTHNVIYNKNKHKIEFHNKCMMCMKCSFECPSNAIKIGLLNRKKVNGSYDFLSINSMENTYKTEEEKTKFYKKFKPYFDYIDSLTK